MKSGVLKAGMRVVVQLDPQGAPRSFRSRRHLYVVRAIVLSWLESAAWWRTDSGDTWVWRVEASESCGSLQQQLTSVGVYDLSMRDDSWVIRRVLD